MSTKPKNQVSVKRLPIGAIIATVVAGFVVIALLLVFLLSGNDTPAKTEAKPSTPTPTATTPPEKVTVNKNKSLPTGTKEDNQKAVINKTQKIFEDINKMKLDQAGYTKLQSELKNGDYSSLPDSLYKDSRFIKDIDTKEVKSAFFSAVIQIANNLNAGLKDQSVKPVIADAWKNTYVDMEAGQAFVPLSQFTGPGVGISFEYVWVDGRWQFAPYSLMENLNSLVGSQQNSDSATQ